jgi:hypothetical protein
MTRPVSSALGASSRRLFGTPRLGALGLIFAWAGALELSGPHREVVLALLPLLLLLASLIAGRYPGEHTLARVRARLQGTPRRPRPQRAVAVATARAVRRPRGGALIGSSLAGRAPPAADPEAIGLA